MKIVAILALFVALAVAQNGLPTNPYYWIFVQGSNTQCNFGVQNNQSSTITQTAFTLLPHDNDVRLSYPNGDTKATIGQISVGSTGYSSFWAIGQAGLHLVTVTVTYKRGLSNYSFSTVVQLQITETGGASGTRDVAEEAYWPADVPSDAEALRSLDARGNDITISPGYFQNPEGVVSWQTIQFTTGSSALRNVSFAVVPSAHNVYINYPTTGNNLGNIPASTTRMSSFSVQAPEGRYDLTLIAMYKKGVSNTQLYEYRVADLAVYLPSNTGTKRSELDLEVNEKAAVAATNVLHNADGSVNVKSAVGLGIGVAFVALVAVGAAVFVARKRNATPAL